MSIRASTRATPSAPSAPAAPAAPEARVPTRLHKVLQVGCNGHLQGQMVDAPCGIMMTHALNPDIVTVMTNKAATAFKCERSKVADVTKEIQEASGGEEFLQIMNRTPGKFSVVYEVDCTGVQTQEEFKTYLGVSTYKGAMTSEFEGVFKAIRSYAEIHNHPYPFPMSGDNMSLIKIYGR